MTTEHLERLMRGQIRSTDMWVDQWQRYKDVAAMRNVALALGKFYGLLSAYIALNDGELEMPGDFKTKQIEYGEVYNTLGLNEVVGLPR